MKQFLLFGYVEYYPGGGCNDLKGDFDTFEEAVEFMNNDLRYPKSVDFNRKNEDYYQILDTETGNVTDF